MPSTPDGSLGGVLGVLRRDAFASFAGTYILVTPRTVARSLDSVRRKHWAPALPTAERRGDRLAFVDGREANDEPGWKTRWLEAPAPRGERRGDRLAFIGRGKRTTSRIFCGTWFPAMSRRSRLGLSKFDFAHDDSVLPTSKSLLQRCLPVRLQSRRPRR
jgi:hypothetical protein